MQLKSVRGTVARPRWRLASLPAAPARRTIPPPGENRDRLLAAGAIRRSRPSDRRRLRQKIGPQVVVENRPGDDGDIGAAAGGYGAVQRLHAAFRRRTLGTTYAFANHPSVDHRLQPIVCRHGAGDIHGSPTNPSMRIQGRHYVSEGQSRQAGGYASVGIGASALLASVLLHQCDSHQHAAHPVPARMSPSLCRYLLRPHRDRVATAAVRCRA